MQSKEDVECVDCEERELTEESQELPHADATRGRRIMDVIGNGAVDPPNLWGRNPTPSWIDI